MKSYREELERFPLKKYLQPLAKSLKIKKISSMNREEIINSILEFERPPRSPRLPVVVPTIINMERLNNDKIISKSEWGDDGKRIEKKITLQEIINKNENRKLKLKYLKLKFKTENTYYEMKPKQKDEIIRKLLKEKKINLIKDLKPIVKSLRIKKISKMNREEIIDSILEFERNEALIIIKKYYMDLFHKYESSEVKFKYKLNKVIIECEPNYFIFKYLKIEELYIDIDFALFYNIQIKRQCKHCNGFNFIEEEFDYVCTDCFCMVEKILFQL